MKQQPFGRVRATISIGVVAVAAIAAACVPPPAPAPTTTTTTTASTSTTEAPTTTASTTTSTTSTTTSTTSTTSTTTSTTTTSTTTSTTLPPGPVTAYTPVAMTCRATASINTSFNDLNTGVTTEYPEQVASGSNFQVELTADPIDVPTEGGGYPISYLRNVRVRFAVPAGTSFVSASLSGGANLGSGTPTVTQSGSIVTLTVPGDLTPGTSAVLPTVTATLQATGAAGTTIEPRLHGNSYDNFSIAFVARVTNVPFLGSVNANTQCYSPANPALATIAII